MNSRLKIKNYFALFFVFAFSCITVNAAKVVANVNGNPITDVDITERTKIMPVSLNNRESARAAIIDDFIKLEYAKSIRIEPTEKEVSGALTEHKDNPQMKLFTRATLAWQMMIMRTIVPTVSVGKNEIDDEMAALERERGLPYEMTILRIVNVPQEKYSKLGKPKSCDDAQKSVEQLGGEAQKFVAVEYELTKEMRGMLAGLEDLKWSALSDKTAVLICGRKKTKEWDRLDEIVKQNAIYKRALFNAEQLLKQLRRKAAITS